MLKTSIIGFMSGDIAGHRIVWTASCCKKCCTIRALCGLALSANAWLSKWGTTRGASTLSRHFWRVRLPPRTYKSNLLSKEKQPHADSYTPTPKSSSTKCPQLTLRHRHARFDRSHDHLGWTIRTCRRVHWVDESHFLLRPTDGRVRVWRQRNTSFQDNHILVTTIPDGGGVWLQCVC
jgi:hypothetical protein